jgi:hypothetical protein
MKLNLSPHHFEEIIKKSYSLDHIFLLKMIYDQLDISALCEESAKVNTLYFSLKRKGLISETEDKITTLGQELLIFIDTKDESKFVKKKTDVTLFEQWFKAYPGTDSFEYKGKKFSGCRSLRQNKDECRLRFDKVLLEGEYDVEIMVAALEYDVTLKKEQSIKTGTNKLTYMQNSLTYLNQRSFEPFIELIKEGHKIEETKSNSTDI